MDINITDIDDPKIAGKIPIGTPDRGRERPSVLLPRDQGQGRELDHCDATERGAS
ncbi:MAG: hypothetical protein IPM01_31600 [Burkholderiaceae bacterium]|nr:hypothetical protein [Burkholderiaceae bacterium]